MNVIEDYVFASCNSLQSIDLPKDVTSIGDFAFHCCFKISTIDIPNSVKKIGKKACCWCNSLTNIRVYTEEPSNINILSQEIDGIFEYVPVKTCVLYVPNGSEELYRQTRPWSDFSNIVGFDPTGIISTVMDEENADYYSVDGKNVSNPNNGIFIKKSNDGTTKKVLIR